MKWQIRKIEIEDTAIAIVENDYICLTDMIQNLEGGNSIIENWLRNKNTIEFIGIWVQVSAPLKLQRVSKRK